MHDPLITIVGLVVLVPFFVICVFMQAKAIEENVPRAVQIAQFQGWVSPHRLMTQANMTKKDAQSVLLRACSEGRLYQAVDGRYYLKQSVDQQIETSTDKNSSRSNDLELEFKANWARADYRRIAAREVLLSDYMRRGRAGDAELDELLKVIDDQWERETNLYRNKYESELRVFNTILM